MTSWSVCTVYQHVGTDQKAKKLEISSKIKTSHIQRDYDNQKYFLSLDLIKLMCAPWYGNSSYMFRLRWRILEKCLTIMRIIQIDITVEKMFYIMVRWSLTAGYTIQSSIHTCIYMQYMHSIMHMHSIKRTDAPTKLDVEEWGVYGHYYCVSKSLLHNENRSRIIYWYIYAHANA